MAQKDWEKWKWNGKKRYYSWVKNNNGGLHAVAVFYEGGWKFQTYKNNFSDTIDVSTKTQAMAYANAYMRKN